MIRKSVVVLASLGLAAVWGSAAFLKALDPPAFAEQITLHEASPAAWSPVLAYLFIGLETLLVAAHLSLFRPRLVFAGSGLLLLFFIGVTGWAWSQGNTEGCGCFGRLAARHPREVIFEDLGFAAVAIVGFVAARSWKPAKASVPIFLGLIPLAVLLPALGPRLPFDSLVTTFNPGEDLNNLAADDLPGPLNEGRILLLLIGEPCPACEAGLPALEQLIEHDGAPRIVAVFAGTRSEARAWSLTHVPPFAVASSPRKVLRQYYRNLPQAALLEDGIIIRVWRNRIPGVEELAPYVGSAVERPS